VQATARAIALGDRGHPERDDIDAAIGHAVMAKRQDDAAVYVGGAPRLLPRAHGLFQFADDLVGDAFVDVSFSWSALLWLSVSAAAETLASPRARGSKCKEAPNARRAEGPHEGPTSFLAEIRRGGGEPCLDALRARGAEPLSSSKHQARARSARHNHLRER
jgi:hypothetical protein